MINTLNYIKEEFKNNNDLIIREIKNKLSNFYIVFLETLVSSDKVNEYVLNGIVNGNKKINGKILKNYLMGPNTKVIDIKEIEYYLTNGFILILYKNKIYAIEARSEISRSVTTPEVQKTLYGPKDAFNENIETNLGLIKRRIKSKHLKSIDLDMGTYTKTKVSLLYIDNITDLKLIKIIKDKLSKIEVDGIIDSGEIANILTEYEHTPFPTISFSERPDKVSKSLLEGKVCIMVDNSPFVLITPSFFIDFINPISDNYNKSINVNFLKILRLVSFFLTMIVPGLYIALINYNMETIPTSLLVNFASQGESVPIPSFIEAIVMIIVCEILRESDLMFPSNYGSAVSILGALIIGDAAVSAGIVSPIMIIIIAFTFITSLIFTEQELINAIRYFRFLFLILASIYGLFGIGIALIFFFLHITSINTLNKPYFFPIIPYEESYFKKTLLKIKFLSDRKRSKYLVPKNIIKERILK